MKLTFDQKLTYAAHLFKAITKARFQAVEPLIAPYIRPDSIVIDVGANAGYYAKIFARMAFKGKVFAFEPGSYARSILQKVVCIRGLNNVSIVPAGLGDRHGKVELHLPLKISGSLGYGLGHMGDDKTVDARETIAETVDILTLDQFVTDKDISRVDFIKIDIEGWELRALEGARNTIKRDHPVLMLEMVDRFLSRAGDSSQKLWDFLTEHGYTMTRYDDNGRTDQLEAPVDEGDILCIFKK